MGKINMLPFNINIMKYINKLPTGSSVLGHPRLSPSSIDAFLHITMAFFASTFLVEKHLFPQNPRWVVVDTFCHFSERFSFSGFAYMIDCTTLNVRFAYYFAYFLVSYTL